MPKSVAITEGNCWEVSGLSPEPEPAIAYSTSPNGTSPNFDMQEFASRHGLRIKSIGDFKGAIKYVLEECPFDSSHRGKDAALFLYPSGAKSFKCWHNSCESHDWQTLREKLEPGCYDRKSDRQTYNGNGKVNGTKEQANAHREPIEYKLITCAELASNDYTVEYLCDGIMAAMQPLIIGALQKTLKTSISLDLAIALASGGYFLGYFKVRRPVPVVFMSGESGMSAIKSTAQAICTAAGIDLASIENLWLSSALPKIGHPEHMTALEEMLVKTGARVLFIDPMYLAMPATDSNNLFATGELLRQVSEICQRLGVTLVLIHHLKKSAATKDGPVDLSDLSWSGYGEFARQWILISRRQPYEHGKPHYLEMVAGGSEGHGAHVALDIDFGVFEPGQPRKWDVLVQSAGEARQGVAAARTKAKSEQQEAQLRSDIRAIVEAAETFPAGESKSVIRDKAGISAARMNLALAVALKEQRIFPCDIYKSNWKEPKEGFSTKQSEQSVKQSEQQSVPSGDHSVGQLGFPIREPSPSGGLASNEAKEGEQSDKSECSGKGNSKPAGHQCQAPVTSDDA
jgi:hypothetical protein